MHAVRFAAFVLLLVGSLATATAQAQTRTFVCPVDGTRVMQVGGDGQPAPKMYSDFEVPTEAYANRIVACSTCGYAQWATEFERPVDGGIVAYVLRPADPGYDANVPHGLIAAEADQSAGIRW